MKVTVTLTAWNEEKSIRDVTERILNHGYLCILVDDGSWDNTPSIARSMGAEVIEHPVNLGQGYAVLTSFKAAIETDCDIIIEMDADGQHNPDEIPVFIQKMQETNADIVVGSRILGKNHPNAPFFRKTFLPHFTNAINRLTGYTMTDAMCGFRAFRRDSLLQVSGMLDAMLEPQYIAAEMFIRFARAGLTVEEVPIHMADRAGGKSSKGLVRYGLGIIKAIFQTLTDKNYRRIQSR